MKKLSSVLLTALTALSAVANAQTCCQKLTDMQALALNTSFKSAHDAPLPFNYAPEKGSMMQFTVMDGKEGNAFYVPANEGTDKILLIFHEWWGLNDYIKKEAEAWQAKLGPNVAVYAIDLYDGEVAVTPDEAAKLMGQLNPKRGEAIINGLLQKIGKGKQIVTLGWCMGGSWSFTGTVLAGTQAKGCVMYYGFPEKNPGKIKALKCDVLYVYGTKDNHIKPTDIKDFETKIKVAGHDFTLHSYDAVHAFANPSNPNYDKKSSGEAEKVAVKFLKEKLGLP